MKKIKLMVIDDNREFCMPVREYAKLTDEIEFYCEAFDGISALRLIRETHPDVILLDSIIPHLDGIGVINHLKSFHEKDRPKIVAITAGLTNIQSAKMQKLGVDYIMSKSTDISEMLNRCMMVCNKKST